MTSHRELCKCSSCIYKLLCEKCVWCYSETDIIKNCKQYVNKNEHGICEV